MHTQDCLACQYGQHQDHEQEPSSGCTCSGECVARAAAQPQEATTYPRAVSRATQIEAAKQLLESEGYAVIFRTTAPIEFPIFH